MSCSKMTRFASSRFISSKTAGSTRRDLFYQVPLLVVVAPGHAAPSAARLDGCTTPQLVTLCGSTMTRAGTFNGTTMLCRAHSGDVKDEPLLSYKRQRTAHTRSTADVQITWNLRGYIRRIVGRCWVEAALIISTPSTWTRDRGRVSHKMRLIPDI